MIKLLRFLKPYRAVLVLVVVLAFAQAIANLYLPTLFANIVDNGIIKGDTGYIWRTGGIMLLITLGGTIAAVVGIFYSSQVATGFGKIIRARLFTQVAQFSLHEFDTVSTSSLITRTTNDTTQVQQVMILVLNMMITAPFTLIAGIILALNQDVGLTWILVVIIPILVGTIVILMSNAIPLFRIMQKKLDKLNLILDEGLTGVRVVRAFDRKKYEEHRFDEANLDLTNVAITVNRLVASLMPIMMLCLNVSSIAILWFGAIRINNGQMQVGALIAFLQYAMLILFALLMISMMFIMLPRAAASADRINEVLAIEPEIKDPDHVKRADKQKGYVEFQHVTFSYPGAEEPAISHISFSAVPGEVTAIIGGTGSGKSTLVSLIPRFYDIDDGTGGHLLVDGVDVREMPQEHLRSKIGFMPQKAVLFSGTIAENIRYGKEDATDEEVRHAADVAQATEFISEMQDGFNSVIAQGGTNVSGGQKQRLSIARALVRKPEIYVFDDSFSALDFKTDAKLRAALKQETRESTVLIVSQRVSTIMDADQIIVLNEGRIAGIGTHRDLMRSSEVYREIVSSQLSMEEIAEEIA
ncbi:MAG TPA: multidrug ABC transporter ATP-binding protein [Ktedonobacter sp.]|nr:multidrug ABC transporter ATP-binding protein [Ktedonobacter sp.]